VFSDNKELYKYLLLAEKYGQKIHDSYYRTYQLFLVLLLSKLYIIWLADLPILNVPDEGYYRNWSCALNLICTFLLLEN